MFYYFIILALLQYYNYINAAPGFAYEPFHDSRFPMAGKGSVSNIRDIINTDFALLSKDTSYVKTYFSTYFSQRFDDIATQHGIKLYLGVYMYDNTEWYQEQIQAAITACSNNSETILGIIIGSETLQPKGTYTPAALLSAIKSASTQIKSHCPNTKIGTAQRINEWLQTDSNIDALAEYIDFIGANVYPFFADGWNPNKPTDLLDKQWSQLKSRFNSITHKLMLTETGWPSSGNSPDGLPGNVPCISNAKAYHYGFWNWDSSSSHPSFVFQAFDRRKDDPILSSSPVYEGYFGMYDSERVRKY